MIDFIHLSYCNLVLNHRYGVMFCCLEIWWWLILYTWVTAILHYTIDRESYLVVLRFGAGQYNPIYPRSLSIRHPSDIVVWCIMQFTFHDMIHEMAWHQFSCMVSATEHGDKGWLPHFRNLSITCKWTCNFLYKTNYRSLDGYIWKWKDLSSTLVADSDITSHIILIFIFNIQTNFRKYTFSIPLNITTYPSGT